MWCVVWVSSRSEGPRFPLLLTFSSHPLYLGIEFEEDLKPILERIWSRSWFILFVSDFLQIWKTHLLYVLRRDILGLWNDYLLRVLRRNLLGLWVCERTICCVCWEGIFWVYEREFFGFMNENLLGLWKGDFLDYQLGEKNVQILRLTLPRKCFIKFYFV